MMGERQLPLRRLGSFRTRGFSDSSDKRASARLETPVRWGVWLGRHISTRQFEILKDQFLVVVVSLSFTYLSPYFFLISVFPQKKKKKHSSKNKKNKSKMSPPQSKADDVTEGEYAADWDNWLETSSTAKLFIDDCLGCMNFEDDWHFNTYRGLVSCLEMCVLAETEDEINDAYVEQVEEFFARRYEVFKEIKDENLQQFQTKTLDNPAPLFSNRKASVCRAKDKKHSSAKDVHLTKIDRYGLLTLSLIDARMHEEEKDCARNRVKIFYLNFLQFAVAVVVFALGSEELDGGHFPPLLASYVSAIVAVFSAVYGILGAIGENEGYLVKFMVANFWLMAILTAFLYTEIFMLKNTDSQCSPGKTSFGTESKEGCDEIVGTYATLLVMAVMQLAVVVCDVYFFMQ